MNKHFNSPKYQINDNVLFVEPTKLNQLFEGFPLFTTEINKEIRTYYFKDDGSSCACGQRSYKFGYIESNNSLNAYCIHCNKKSKIGVKQLKNNSKRDNKHMYFADYQKEKGRYFCECCLNKNTPLNIHHIIQVKDNGSNEPENLQLLCKPCHDIVHCIRTYKEL